MNKIFQENIWINRVGMGAIVLVSLGYVLFGSSFAQLRLEFSFLNFPIFIGEILLGFSLLLLIVKSARQKQELGHWGWILGVYLFFVLFKAFSGYFVWGPLAFRDSALFYYPLFIVLGYSFWSSDLGGDRIRRLFIILIVPIFILRQYVAFWPCSLLIMGVILALQAKSLQERVILTGAIFLFAPYEAVLNIYHRTIFLSSLITVIFIGIISFLLLCKDRWPRIIGMVLGGLILGIVLFKIGQTGLWSTYVIRDAKPLAVSSPQEPARGKYLFHPVGSSPEKPDTMKEFWQRMSKGCFFMEKKCAMEKKSAMEKKFAMGKKPGVENKPFFENKPAIANGEDVLVTKKDDTRFRYYIWRDMLFEYIEYKPFFGFAFGRPLCSSAIFKYYGVASTQYTDGWVGAHNSFFYIIYRAGIVGLIMVLSLLLIWCGLLRDFYVLKDWTGLLLCAILLNWLVSANFFLIFELPDTAIPLWTILGVTLKYRMLLKKLPHTIRF